MPGLLEGQAAVITGAASGMGRATARSFADEGARLVVADVDEQGARSLADELETGGAEVLMATTDIGDASSVHALVETVVDAYGRLDIAFNSAGIEQLERAPIGELSLDEFDRIMRVDLTGMFLCLKYELAQMAAQGGPGSIVCVSSGSALKGVPRLAAYVAAKHGVLGLTRTAALEYGHLGIRVNVICPGVIDTPMYRRTVERGALPDGAHIPAPLSRRGAPDEIASTAVYLCSNQSSYVTGQAISVDGGLSCL